MYQLAASFWKGTALSSTPVQVKSIEHPLTTLIKDKVNINQTSEAMLWTLRSKLRIAGVKEDHHVLKEINQKLSGIALPTLGLPQPKFKHAFTAKPDERSYVQSPEASIEDTKKELEALKGKLDAIQLCNVSDDLMAFVVKNFPDLTSLKLIGDDLWLDFTDAGLQSIAEFKNLEVLTMDIWDSLLNVSYDCFTKLIQQNNFSSKLKELKISTFFLVDSALPGLAKYSQLNTLWIHSAWIKEPDLSMLFSSPTLKKSVKDFSFLNSNPGALTDATISKLKDFKQLEHLTLGEGAFDEYVSKVSVPTLIAFLDTQKKLKTLDLRGPSIDGPIAEKIGAMNELETLRLTDCSKMPWQKSWEVMLGGKTKLTHLDLKNTPCLDKDNLPFVANLPLNFLSIDLGDNGLSDSVWMNILCTNAGLKKTLKTLHLTHLTNFKASTYVYLPLLENLSTLRLDQCPWFNEEGMKFLTDNTTFTKNLTTLELASTSIDDNAIPMMAKFEQLKNLLLGPSPALTAKGCNLVLSDPQIQKQIVVFAVDNFSWTVDDFRANLPNFNALKTIIISNDDSLPIAEGGYDSLYEISKAKGFALKIGWGLTGYIQMFEDAIQSHNPISLRKE